MPRPNQDNEAIAASVDDPTRFSAVFDRHFRAIHRYLQRQLGLDLADELSAQTFFVAFDKRESFDVAYESALPWLYGIATNLVRRHRRDVRRQLSAYARVDMSTRAEPMEGIEERVDAARERKLLVEALKSLPRESLETILLHTWAELSYTEIAQALGIPLGTVQSRINRARAKIREQVERERARAESDRVESRGPNQGDRLAMDELERIGELGSDQPSARAEVQNAARAALLERAAESAGAETAPRRQPRRRIQGFLGLSGAVAAAAVVLFAFFSSGKAPPATPELARAAEIELLAQFTPNLLIHGPQWNIAGVETESAAEGRTVFYAEFHPETPVRWHRTQFAELRWRGNSEADRITELEAQGWVHLVSQRVDEIDLLELEEAGDSARPPHRIVQIFSPARDLRPPPAQDRPLGKERADVRTESVQHPQAVRRNLRTGAEGRHWGIHQQVPSRPHDQTIRRNGQRP